MTRLRLLALAVLAGLSACGVFLGIDDVSFTTAPVEAGGSDASTEDRAPTPFDAAPPEPDADADPVVECPPELPEMSDAACDGGTLDDPHNCGWCGHDCQRSFCMNHECVPDILSGETLRTIVARVDGTSVSWVDQSTDGGVIYRAPKDAGGGAEMVVGSVPVTPEDIAADDDGFYVLAGDAILRVNPGGGAPSFLADAGTFFEGAIVVRASTLYWTTNGGSGGTLKRVRTDGTALSTLEIFPTDPVHLLAFTGDQLVFATSRGKVDGTIWVSDAGFQTARTVANGFPVGGLAADGQDIFASDPGKGRILRISPDGGLRDIATGLVEPTWLAAAKGEVYFVALRNGSHVIEKTTRCGGPARILASGRIYPTRLTVDGDFIYWGSDSAGVRRVAR